MDGIADNLGTYWLYGVIGILMMLLCTLVLRLWQHNRLKRMKSEADLTPEEADAAQRSFFTATFSVMGYVAKADGRVRQSEIALAECVMKRMNLNSDQRSEAIALFNKGKLANFKINTQVRLFREECVHSKSLYRAFLEIQIQAALADGKMDLKEEDLLLRMAKELGIGEKQFRQLEMLVRVTMGLGDDHSRRYRKCPKSTRPKKPTPNRVRKVTTSVEDAYVLLGVNEKTDDPSVKQAYRKLISQHHPDKLVSEGLPDGMVKLAGEKTQEIRNAYEQIKRARSE